MKKILVTIFIIIIVAIIYIVFKDNKIYYVSISDRLNNDYSYKDYIKDYLDELNILEKYSDISDIDNRITDIIRNIEDNQEYDGKNIKNILIKADILTLSVGYNDIITKMDKYNIYTMYGYIDTFLSDLNSLYSLLREYDKEKIIMLGYYNPYSSKYNDIINYINQKVENLCLKYNIDYIDISDINKYLVDKHISIEGEHFIFDKSRRIIDDKIKRK